MYKHVIRAPKLKILAMPLPSIQSNRPSSETLDWFFVGWVGILF